MFLALTLINKMARLNESTGILLKLVYPCLLTPLCPRNFGTRPLSLLLI